MNEFFINTRLGILINQKIMNILWNARASTKCTKANPTDTWIFLSFKSNPTFLFAFTGNK